MSWRMRKYIPLCLTLPATLCLSTNLRPTGHDQASRSVAVEIMPMMLKQISDVARTSGLFLSSFGLFSAAGQETRTVDASRT